jgi:hypothetical protein
MSRQRRTAAQPPVYGLVLAQWRGRGTTKFMAIAYLQDHVFDPYLVYFGVFEGLCCSIPKILGDIRKVWGGLLLGWAVARNGTQPRKFCYLTIRSMRNTKRLRTYEEEFC